ncbi:hypothetical protein FACS189425_10130 [Clostridia bacterium]|nr:hypothetical protein FACS189425_10130 [Clostridia bacterium]
MRYSTLFCICDECDNIAHLGAIGDVVKTDNIGCYQFEGIIRNCVLRFKFAHCTDYAETMGLVMTARLLQEHTSADFDVVVPMPIGPKRLKKRGYNHAELLAKSVAKHLLLPLDNKTLLRPTDTAPQSTLTGEERLKNLKGKFVAQNDVDLAGMRVLLIDDVYTTGATMQTATAELIKNAKAKSVQGLTFAQTY